MQFKPKNREWVKNAAIIFLAVLLVLTFFSNTIMNRTLPEVATQYVTSGTVTARVRGTGTVVANGSHQVKAESTREIRSVMVRVGQEVNAGDVLFILGEGDAEDLDAAQEELRQLQISYQRAAINSPTFNYSTEERKLKSAEEEYNAAKSLEEAALKALEEGSGIPQEKLDAALTKLQEAKDIYESLSQQTDAKLNELKEAVNKALQEYNNLRKELGLPEASSPAEALDQSDEYITTVATRSTGTRLVLLAAEPTESLTDTLGEADSSSPSSAAPTTEPSQQVTNPPQKDELDPEAQERLEKARQALADAQLALQSATFPELTAAQQYVDYCQQEYDTLLSYGGTLRDDYEAAKAARQTAEENYLTLKDALDSQKESDNKSQALAGLDMADIAAQIERQKKKIEELAGGDTNQVTANVSGTVESIECTAGDTVMEDGILCTIEVPDMGYTLSFSVTNDQARRLTPGDTASVTNYYWGSQIDATLSTIRVDPEKPQTNKLLTFDLEGDVSAGAEITLSVGQRSAGYDTIVPNSAIRSDTNGSFVLIVESKSSPLGNRYIARRVDVEVLAADDVNSAVTGDLSDYSYVITTSNAPVNSGDMVRMADT